MLEPASAFLRQTFYSGLRGTGNGYIYMGHISAVWLTWWTLLIVVSLALLSLKAKTPSFGPYALVLTPTRTGVKWNFSATSLRNCSFMRSKSNRKKIVTAASRDVIPVMYSLRFLVFLYKSEHDLKNTRWMNLRRGHFVDMAVKHWDDHGLWHEQWWKGSWFQFHRQWSSIHQYGFIKLTLQGTNISPKNGILKMIFLFPRWDMLISLRVCMYHKESHGPKIGPSLL